MANLDWHGLARHPNLLRLLPPLHLTVERAPKEDECWIDDCALSNPLRPATPVCQDVSAAMNRKKVGMSLQTGKKTKKKEDVYLLEAAAAAG